MTYGGNFILPVAQDNDNNGLDTPSGTTSTQENTNAFWCTLPPNMSTRDRLFVQIGGWSRDYSAAGEAGHSVVFTDHDQADLSTAGSEATTAYSFDGGPIDAKRYIVTPHADLLTHANTTKKQCWFTHKKNDGTSSRMCIINPCVFVVKAA